MSLSLLSILYVKCRCEVQCCPNAVLAVFFYQFAVKRKAVGIWGCKDCGKVKAGGAYTMKYVLNFNQRIDCLTLFS